MNPTLLLIYPTTEKKQRLTTLKNCSSPTNLPHCHTWEKRAFRRASENSLLHFVRENESKLSIFWAPQWATLPSQSKNFPHFPLHQKMSENIFVCFCLASTPRQFIHPSKPGQGQSPLLSWVFLDAKVAEVQCLPVTHSPTNRGFYAAYEWVLALWCGGFCASNAIHVATGRIWGVSGYRVKRVARCVVGI